MAIPYGRQSIDQSDIDAVVEVLGSDWLTTGPKVAEFEAAIARTAGTADATVVTSGTAALHVAYAAMGIGAGDEVVTTPMTFAATATTAMALGATVTFADIREDTGNIDPAAVAEHLTDRTRVVAAVDYGGQPADIDDLIAIAHPRGALVLEDAAHSIASLSNGRPVGSFADVTTFSFFPTKNLTSGEGGAVASPDADLVARARRFRGIGITRDPAEQRYPDEGPWHLEVQGPGLNYRLPDILCALGLSQLRRIDDFKARRTAIFDRYVAGLSDVDGLRLPTTQAGVDPMWHLFSVRVPADRRRSVYDFLRANGVLVQVNYIPTYWHPYFEDLGYLRGQCPVAEQFYREQLSLPMFADLGPSDQDRVIELVREALQ
jgi:dTDP-4-amino-4,6-dideoxygalactose transaminase